MAPFPASDQLPLPDRRPGVSGVSGVPAPQQPQLPGSRGGLLPARARIRASLPLDLVTFTAPCPACGRDCEWEQQREDTRLRTRITCSHCSTADQPD